MWRNSILFAEISEDRPTPPVLTTMLRALAATGALGRVRGILFGRPFGDPSGFEDYDKVVQQVLAELDRNDLALVTRMDFGHTDPKFVVPYGVEAEIDCDLRQLQLLESPVTL